LEDRAWLCGVPQDYDSAIQAYDLAEKTRGYSPEPCIGRARCLYKAGVFGGRKDGIDEALRELEYVSETFTSDQLSQADVYCLRAKAYQKKGDLVLADGEYRKAWEILKIKDPGDEALRKIACLQDWGDCCLEHAHKLLLSTDRSTVSQWAAMAIFCADSLKGLDVVRANLLRAKATGYQAKTATTDRRKLQEKALELYNATEKQADLSQKSRFELLFQRAELKRELDQKDDGTIKDYDAALLVALTAEDRAAARGGGGLTRMDLGRALLRQGRRDDSVLAFNEAGKQLKEAIAEAPSHPSANSWRLMLSARLLRGATKEIRDQRADEIRQMLSDGLATSAEGMRNDFETLRQEFNRHYPEKRI
jgi:tetratricopeptide (TPR) repeat protein